jgi:uncharacterized protein (TIGR02421 family)
LVREVSTTLAEQFGAFMLVEIWTGSPRAQQSPIAISDLAPRFRVVGQLGSARGSVLDELEQNLSRVRIGKRAATVTSETTRRCAPNGMLPLMRPETARVIGCQVYGIEVAPVFRDPETDQVFPAVLRMLRRRIAVAMRQSFFRFAQQYTDHRPSHFHALGRQAVVKAVWEVDRILAETEESFDFLLQVTPVNGEQAWNEFKRRHFERRPTLHYRPTAIEPIVLKRQLYRAPVERIEDPALAGVFREKLDDIDRRITMLQDRNTPRFLHESIQLFGGVEQSLFDGALELLRAIPPRSRERFSSTSVDARKFAERAWDEIKFLRDQHPDVTASVEIRPDVTGLMVARGNLLISDRLSVPESRLEALIQHEVGTHVLTYHNGRSQRLRHLCTGFAGYDALQEGLAVLSEYLVGGLSRPRLRLLAGRVIAARCLIDGATFVECYRRLHEDHGFASKTAFVVTVRTFRGGGLTKDAVYLRGLRQILEYVGGGGDLEPLFVGKIAAQHIPIVRELQWRGVLTPPPLLPRYMASQEARARLHELRGGKAVSDLIEGRKR